MTAQAFVFEPARCTGCEACRVACAIENRLPLAMAWRQVHHANPAHLPWAPAFHLSMACNHCDRPACLEGCPAAAYTRDAGTGAVLLDEARCIGCRYCSWMCPYDAPRFDQAKGVTAKCTFCHSRLLAGQTPACSSTCPTGALGVEPRSSLPEPEFPGIPRRGLGPGLRVVGSEPRPPRGSHSATGREAAWLPAAAARTPRIALRSEWTLVVFTTLVPLLVGAQIAGLFHGLPRVAGMVVLALGALAGGLGLLHLGRPGRAWRAMANLRSSWLSREILAFSLFFPLAVAQRWLGFAGPGAWAVALVGVALLLCIDRVYQTPEGRPPWRLRSGEAILSGLFWAALLAGSFAALLPLALGRLWLLFRRGPERFRAGFLLPAAIRTAGLVLPVLAAWGRPGPPSLGLAGLVLVAELLDRAAFFQSLRLPDPGALVEAAGLRDGRSGLADPA